MNFFKNLLNKLSRASEEDTEYYESEEEYTEEKSSVNRMKITMITIDVILGIMFVALCVVLYINSKSSPASNTQPTPTGTAITATMTPTPTQEPLFIATPTPEIPATPTPRPSATPRPTATSTPKPTSTPTPVINVKIEEVNQTVWSTASLNVRSGPGTGYQIIGGLQIGQKVTRTGITENGWSRIIYYDEPAYVSSEYISLVEPTKKATPTPSPVPTAKATPTPVVTTGKFPDFSGSAYCIMDANSGKVLYSKNENVKNYPANLVNMLTAIIAVENSQSLEDEFTASNESLKNASIDSTIPKFGVTLGTTYKLSEWLHLMLMQSAADASDTIAQVIASSIDIYLEAMNFRAQDLGMTSSYFDNTIGLDATYGYNNTYSTAKDLCLLTKAFMEIDELAAIAGKATYALPASNLNSAATLENTNLLLTSANYRSSRFTVIGSKAGYTASAGQCVAATASDTKGHKVIIVYLNGPSRSTVASETFSMFEYVFSQYDSGKISLTAK